MIRLIFIKKYEMIARSRWGWHTFRKDGRIIGFRFLGIGLAWDKREVKESTDGKI